MNFLVKYNIIYTDGTSESKVVRIKNCLSHAHAKVRLDDYLQRNYLLYSRLEVINCVEDNALFNLFGKDNPFV